MEIKKNLTLTEMNLLYTTMIDSLYDDDDEYRYQFEDYLWRRAVIEAYTDIPIPQDMDESYKFCYDTAMWSTVMTHIDDMEQLNEVKNAVHRYCEHKEKQQLAGLQFHSLMEDMQSIMTAISNLGDLPEFLASFDEGENPLLGGE